MSTNMIFFLFFTISFTILIIGHAPIFFSIIQYFDLVTLHSRLLLGAVFLLMPGLFIGANYWIHTFGDGFLPRSLYILGSMWIGALAGMLMFFGATWVILLVSKFAGWTISLRLLGILAISATVVYSIIAYVNAQHPIIRNVEVKIKNLPPEWNGKTAVMFSDLHVGTIIKKPFVERITSQIKALQPDVIFVVGDLLDGAGDHILESTLPLASLRAPLGNYFVTGNHETYVGLDKAEAVMKQLPNFSWLKNDVVDVQGVEIAGISFTMRKDRDNIQKNLDKLSRDKPHVILFHTPTDLDLFSQTGPGLMLSGHTHNGQLFPYNLATYLIFKGYDFGLHKINDLWLYTSNGVGTWGPPMRIGNRPEIVRIKFNKD